VTTHDWWERLCDLDQQTLLIHRTRFCLPPEVIVVYEASGGPSVEPIDGRRGRYRWPASVRVFLFDQAATDSHCEWGKRPSDGWRPLAVPATCHTAMPPVGRAPEVQAAPEFADLFGISSKRNA
jgi:hypothetical protein